MKPVYRSSHFTIFSDHVTWLEHKASVLSSREIHSTYPGSQEIPYDESKKRYIWRQQKELGHYPAYKSEHPLLEALYYLSLEELERNRTAEGALWHTGARWKGVWTRDISYSVILSLALLDPHTAKNCLLVKTKNNRIIQDTGTGGSWPVSTDRVSWILAAWEIYLVTGEISWLKKIYPIIENTLYEDEKTIYYPDSPALGESSFLDWREQTYPPWMNATDIFRSENLATNCVHYQANYIAARISRILGYSAQKYRKKVQCLKEQINDKFWMEEEGYYGQYRYGRHYLTLSPRAESLGESLAILFDIASPQQKKRITENTPVGKYGIPSVFPQTARIPPYHNNGIWQFVQAFWNLASVHAGNMASLEHGLASIYRATALFLTNKENIAAHSGVPHETEINSDRQLWSIAGTLAMVYRVFFGMNFSSNRLVFKPFIPRAYGNHHILKNFSYRNMLLNIEIKGWGTRIRSFKINEKEYPPFIKGDSKGKLHVAIQMEEEVISNSPIALSNITFAPQPPHIQRHGNTLQWDNIPGIREYVMYDNGKPIKSVQDNRFSIPEKRGYHEYQVKSIDNMSLASHLSKPVIVNSNPPLCFSAEEFDGKNPDNQKDIFLSPDINTRIGIEVSVEKEGLYLVGFSYTNGTAEAHTSHTCALRTLYLDEKEVGTMVFPVTGKNQWKKPHLSNQRSIFLTQGSHQFTLKYEPWNKNMREKVNELRLHKMLLEKL